MQSNNPSLRIAAALVMIASMIWGFWWLTWSLAIVFLLIFPAYYEILFWGVAYDSLYAVSLQQFWGATFVFTLAGLVLFVLGAALRKFLFAYDS